PTASSSPCRELPSVSENTSNSKRPCILEFRTLPIYASSSSIDVLSAPEPSVSTSSLPTSIAVAFFSHQPNFSGRSLACLNNSRTTLRRNAIGSWRNSCSWPSKPIQMFSNAYTHQPSSLPLHSQIKCLRCVPHFSRSSSIRPTTATFYLNSR